MYNSNTTFEGKGPPPNLNCQNVQFTPPFSSQGTLELQSSGKTVCLTLLWVNHVLQSTVPPRTFNQNILTFLSQGSSDFNMLDKDFVSMEWTIVHCLCHLISQVKSLAYEVCMTVSY